MTEGAFRSMQHDHVFREYQEGDTEMEDHFVFAAPIPVLGQIAEAVLLRRYMTRFLLQRNAVLKQIAESDTWKQFLPDGA